MDTKLVELREADHDGDEEAPDEGEDHSALVSDEFRRMEDARGEARRRADAPVFERKPRRIRLGCIVPTVTVAVVVAIAIAFAISRGDSTSTSCAWAEYRLPTYFRPRAYTWNVRPQFAEPYRFNGTVTIDIDAITGGQECIVLSARGLDVTRGEVITTHGSSRPFVKHWWPNSDKDLLTVQLSSAPAAGNRLSLTLAYVRAASGHQGEHCLTRSPPRRALSAAR